MDRSFLSEKSVIDAARDFVCVRLATYESAEEAEFMTQLFRRHKTTGLANTTFAFLDPTGKVGLTRAGRGPNSAFRDAQAMASGMKSLISDRYPTTTSQRYTDTALPFMANFELGLNVAACDQSLMIAIVSDAPSQQKVLEKQMLRIAWSDEFAGQFIYTRANTSDLKNVIGKRRDAGIVIIEPDAFGLTGKVLDWIPTGFDAAALRSTLRARLAEYRPPSKDTRSHIQTGINLGFDWKTVIPVTDREANRARERARGN